MVPVTQILLCAALLILLLASFKILIDVFAFLLAVATVFTVMYILFQLVIGV